MLNKIALLAVLSLTDAAIAQHKSTPPPPPLEEASGPTIGYDSVAKAREAVRTNPKARMMADWDWTTYQIGKMGQPDYELWAFSPPSHPAHPSAVRRTIDVREGQAVVDMDAKCEAAKPACDQMVRDFQAINLKFQQSINAPQKR